MNSRLLKLMERVLREQTEEQIAQIERDLGDSFGDRYGWPSGTKPWWVNSIEKYGVWDAEKNLINDLMGKFKDIRSRLDDEKILKDPGLAKFANIDSGNAQQLIGGGQGTYWDLVSMNVIAESMKKFNEMGLAKAVLGDLKRIIKALTVNEEKPSQHKLRQTILLGLVRDQTRETFSGIKKGVEILGGESSAKSKAEPGKAMASPKAKEGVDYVYTDDDEYDYRVIKGKWHTRHTRHGGTNKSWTPMDKYPSTVKKLNDGLSSGKTQEMMQGDVREEPPGPTGPGVVNEALVRVTPAQIRRMIKSWR